MFVRSPMSDEGVAERRAFIAMSQLSWLTTFALLGIVIFAIERSPIVFEFDEFPAQTATLIVFLPVALAYTYLRFDSRVASGCDSLAVLSAFASVSAVYTYLGTYWGADRPFVDAGLLAVDRAIGFDWMGMLAWLDARPALAELLNTAYASIMQQTVCLIVLLVVFKQERRLQIFVLATQLCLIVTGSVPAIFPAIGAYPYLEVVRELHHPAITLSTMNYHVEEVLQLRGAHPVIDLQKMEGIVVIPSFHMALAVLFTWGFWAVPLARWVGLAVNVAMAASTPLSGGHYLVDLVAGALLAVAAIVLASQARLRFENWSARSRSRVVPERPILEKPAFLGAGSTVNADHRARPATIRP